MAAEQQLAAMDSRLGQLESVVLGMRNDMADHVRTIEAQKLELVDQLNKEFAQHKTVMSGIIDGARKEFGDLKTGLNKLYHDTEAALS